MNEGPASDLLRVRSELLTQTRQVISGARLQRERIIERDTDGWRPFGASDYEFVETAASATSDLDYFAFELGRLRNIAVRAVQVFVSPKPILDAIAEFDRSMPKVVLDELPLRHRDHARSDDQRQADSTAQPTTDASEGATISPRRHHQAAERLALALTSFLSEGVART